MLLEFIKQRERDRREDEEHSEQARLQGERSTQDVSQEDMSQPVDDTVPAEQSELDSHVEAKDINDDEEAVGQELQTTGSLDYQTQVQSSVASQESEADSILEEETQAPKTEEAPEEWAGDRYNYRI